MKSTTQLLLISTFFLLNSCSYRDLTNNESAFLGQFHRTHVDYDSIRIHNGIGTSISESKLQLLLEADNNKDNALGRPITASEAAFVLRGLPSAVTLANNIYFRSEFYSSDFADGWPGPPRDFTIATLLAHEVTHVWQYQRRDITGYSLAKVIAEHLRYKDPYQYEPIESGKSFLEYRFEQQGQMVQDYANDYYINPNGPRYKKLDSLIRDVIPLYRFLINSRIISKKN